MKSNLNNRQVRGEFKREVTADDIAHATHEPEIFESLADLREADLRSAAMKVDLAGEGELPPESPEVLIRLKGIEDAMRQAGRPEQRVQMSVRLTPAAKRWLRTYCLNRDVSLNQYVLEAINARLHAEGEDALLL